jgi:hypothetical protein
MCVEAMLLPCHAPTSPPPFASILVIGGPLFIEGVAAIGQQLVATSCLGHVGNPAALSALILAQSLYAVTGYSLVSGLASALETLCGQVCVEASSPQCWPPHMQCHDTSGVHHCRMHAHAWCAAHPACSHRPMAQATCA